MPASAEQQFAIASHLLGQPQHGLGWSNLGYWPNADDYDTACQQLAERIGLAARLKPDDRILELACGQGASLNYWHKRFQVQHLHALELQPILVKRIRQQQPAVLRLIAQGRFDQLPLPELLEQHIQPQGVDVVVCVDAAYHASSVADFANVSRHCLRPGGRLSFSTLTLDEMWLKASRWQQRLHQQLLNAADVPMASVCTQEQIKQQLGSLGFVNIQVQHLDSAVLDGFAQFVQQRATQLSLKARMQPAWLKIAITARLCRFLKQQGLVHYSVVSAQRAS